MNNEIKQKLIEFANNEEKLKSYNPYLSKDAEGNFSDEKFDQVIKDFIDIYDNDGNNNSFSWIDKLNSINKDLGPDMPVKIKSANLSYGLPTHVSGDYENGLIYHCLFNPGSNKISDEKFLVDNTSLKDYYDMKENNIPNNAINPSSNSESGSTLNERVQSIKKYIFSEDSVFTKDILRKRKDENAETYYIDQYYGKGIFNSRNSIYLDESAGDDDIRVRTNKLVNIEFIPFVSLNSSFVNSLEEDYKKNKFSMYSAYLILYRIGKHLANEDAVSPIFCFRRYMDYKNLIIESITNVCSVDESEAEQIFVDLYNKYFYNLSSENGGYVTKGNLIRYSNPLDKNGDKEYINPEIFDRLVEYL